MALYASEHSTGALYRLLARQSLLGVLLPVDKQAISAGRVLQAEYDELMGILANPHARKVSHSSSTPAHTPHWLICVSSPLVAQVNLIPMQAAITAAKSLGA